MSTGGDKGAGDDCDLVLDENFVNAGRTEASAVERAARAARIEANHRQAAAWRAAERQPAKGHLKANLIVAVVVVLVLGWTAFSYFGPALPGGGTVEDAATEPVSTPPAAPSVFSAAKPLGTPPPVPAGTGDVRFMAMQDDNSGNPVAFDPCREMHYVIRPQPGPPGARLLLSEGLAELSRATGLVLVSDGITDEAPSDERPTELPRYGPGYAPVLIAWSNEEESPDLAGYIAGFSGGQGVTSTVPGSRRYVSGQMVLDSTDFRRILERPGGRAVARAIILHELGHLVGLAHVSDRSQIMFSESTPKVTGYQHGDLTGLSRLGQGPCFVN